MKAKKIWLILLLALILRLVLLDASFWLDEAAQVLESARPLSQQLQIRDDFQPPLMHLVTFLSLRLIDFFKLTRSEALIRLLPSLIPGLITIWATYRLALIFFAQNKNQEKIALWAALLLSLSSFHIFYSQELRPYSLPAMWATLATLSLLQIKAPKQRRLFVLFSVLGLYSTYLYPFFLLAQFAYLLVGQEFKKSKVKSLFLLALPIVLAFLPWLPKFYEQLITGQALRSSMPGWEEVVSVPQIKSLVLVPFKFLFGVLNIEASSFYMISSLLIFSSLIWVSWQSQKKERQFFAYLLVLPLLLAWIISFFVPVLHPKRVLYLLPYFALLVSFAFFKLREKSSNWALLFISSFLAVNLISTAAYYQKPALQREDWRALVQEVASKYPPESSAIVFSFKSPFAPWEFYAQKDYQTFSSGVYYMENLPNPEETFKDLTAYRYALVFDYLRDLTDPEDQLLATLRDLGFSEIGALDYPNIGLLRIYQNGKNLAYENWD